ncbi:MAG: class I SAM-dependent methyltransferase [Thermoplasmatota archaeon]
MKISEIITNSRRILSCYFFNLLELFAVKTEFFYQILMSWRKPVFVNEIQMANVHSDDNILLIGCGIFPSEVMVIANQTGAQVTGIDNSSTAVRLAKKFIMQKNLNKQITILYADGTNLTVKDFDIIFIAINVFPIDQVLKNLSTQIEKGTKIMCKSIKHDIPQVFKNSRLDTCFDIIDTLENPRTQSYLLIKK